MPILSRLERRSSIGSYHPSSDGTAALFGSPMSTSGATVTPETSMSVMAVYRAVRLLAQTLASLPLLVVESLDDGSLRPAPKHPLSQLLTGRPNKWQTPFEFKEMLGGHLELRGNAYAEIVADGRGRPTSLVPLHPSRVIPMREFVANPNGSGDTEITYYQYWPLLGSMRVLFPDEILHLRGFSFDGLVGVSPVTLARETIGLAMSAEEHASRFFSNNASPGGVLSITKALDEPAKKRLKRSWEEMHSGSRNAHKVAVLEEGMSWQAIGLNNKDSEFIANRQFQVIEIARMFDLPPHKLMDMESSTDNNIEHQAIEFVTDAIRPRAVRWEEAIERDCLLSSDAGRYRVRFALQELMRGDSAARATYYREMWGIGALSTNDIRRMENESAVAGGDQRFVPLNMVPLERAADLPASTEPAAAPPGGKQLPAVADAQARALRDRIAAVHRRLFVDAITRTLKREVSAARAAAQLATRAQNLGPVVEWIDEFYQKHEGFAHRALLPALELFGDAIASAAAHEVGLPPDTFAPSSAAGRGLHSLVKNTARLAARSHVVTSRAALQAIVESHDPAARDAQFAALFAEWDSRRADAAADTELRDTLVFVVEYVYRHAGVTPPSFIPPVFPVSERSDL